MADNSAMPSLAGMKRLPGTEKTGIEQGEIPSLFTHCFTPPFLPKI
jgi:hypothetical protein